MWVKGDLKDQLGIAHRNGKNRDLGRGDVEAAPMFNHARNASDLSLHQGKPCYEPVLAASPSANSPSPYLDTPPIDSPYAYDAIDTSHLAPSNSRGYNRQMAPTPQSYYSASDIPPSSPLPSPKYMYSDGQVTSTPPSRRTSVATARTPRHDDYARSMSPPMSPPMQSLQIPSSHGHGQGRHSPGPAQYIEMDQRGGGSYSPTSPSYQSSHHAFERSASDSSFTTARDDFVHAESDIGVHPPGHLAVGDPGYGAPYDDRRASAMSWQGGRAL